MARCLFLHSSCWVATSAVAISGCKGDTEMEDEEPDDDQIEVVIGCASVVLALWGLAAIAAFVLFMVWLVQLL